MPVDSRRPLLVYDGQCGFCTASAEWVAETSRPGRASIVAWQDLADDGLSALGLSQSDAMSAAWWVDEGDRLWRGNLAIAQALCAGTGWRRLLGRLLLFPPLRPLGSVVYALIARCRSHIPAPRRRSP